MGDIKHVPDIMEVIADLSNDEVRTPPRVANEVLDLLPEEVWSNPDYRWLDPGTKSGVFLREATKRLMVGLVDQFPDEQLRLEHILNKQIFAVATTSLTGLMSRRALYCSKFADGSQSVVRMPTSDGNVWHQRAGHAFANQRCTECGANQDRFGKLDGENFAYGFIHGNGRKIIGEAFKMKFDVVVGNPPYQMEADSSGQNVNPIYNLFVETAIDLSPKHIAMVIPSRWMAGGKGLDDFRMKMLSSGKLEKLVDFPNATEIFPQVDVKGGVCYFLWAASHSGACEYSSVRDGQKLGPHLRDLAEFDVLVRDERALPILKKVLGASDFSAGFSSLVSMRDPFGPKLSSNFTNYRKAGDDKPGDLLLHLIENGKRVERKIDSHFVTKNEQLVRHWKLFLPKAYGAGESVPHQIIGVPEIGVPNSVCTMSYIVAGPFNSEAETKGARAYLHTRFARFLISLRKISQNTTSSVYSWLPQLDWTVDWTDEMLYAKYGITAEEQHFIAEMIKEMPTS